MTTSFRSETFDLSTDTHLADRARMGSVPAFDELVTRHVEQAVAMAMVVSGDARAAVDVGARAFTDILDQMASGGYSIDDPYLPGLLRSARELALADTTADPALRERMDRRLPELARSTRWLDRAAHLAAIDVALALDIEDLAVDGIIDWTDNLIADHADAVDAVLRNVQVLIPTTFAAESLTIWRRWLATAGMGGPTGVVRGPSRLAAIEPVAGRILRGAAVLLIVVGAVGAAVGAGQLGGNDGGHRRLSEQAVADRSSGPGAGANGTRATRDAAGTSNAAGGGVGAMVNATASAPSATRGHDAIANASTNPNGHTGGALDASGQGVALPSHAAGSATAANSATAPVSDQPAAGTTGTPSAGTRPTATPAAPGVTPASPASPASPATPAAPATPTLPVKPPAIPSAPSTPPTPTPTPTPPPVTVPPVLAPVVNTVTGILGGVTGGLGLGH